MSHSIGSTGIQKNLSALKSNAKTTEGFTEGRSNLKSQRTLQKRMSLKINPGNKTAVV